MQNNLPNPLRLSAARPAKRRALEDLLRRASLMLDEVPIPLGPTRQMRKMIRSDISSGRNIRP